MQNPISGGPLLMPSSASIEKNLEIGEALSNLPADEKAAVMTAFFLWGNPFDYQRSVTGKYDSTYRDFGNFNYGAVAAAAGYSLEEAQHYAGLVNQFGTAADKSTKDGNSVRNAEFIRLGFEAYKAGRLTASGPRKND